MCGEESNQGSLLAIVKGIRPKTVCDITKSYIPGLCFNVDLLMKEQIKVHEKVFSLLIGVYWQIKSVYLI